MWFLFETQCYGWEREAKSGTYQRSSDEAQIGCGSDRQLGSLVLWNGRARILKARFEKVWTGTRMKGKEAAKQIIILSDINKLNSIVGTSASSIKNTYIATVILFIKIIKYFLEDLNHSLVVSTA